MSSIAFAHNPDVIVDTIEKYESFAKVARLNIEKEGLTNRINVIVDDALGGLFFKLACDKFSS
jgi:predicted O-methyltransferase YrrM